MPLTEHTSLVWRVGYVYLHCRHPFHQLRVHELRVLFGRILRGRDEKTLLERVGSGISLRRRHYAFPESRPLLLQRSLRQGTVSRVSWLRRLRCCWCCVPEPLVDRRALVDRPPYRRGSVLCGAWCGSVSRIVTDIRRTIVWVYSSVFSPVARLIHPIGQNARRRRTGVSVCEGPSCAFHEGYPLVDVHSRSAVFFGIRSFGLS